MIGERISCQPPLALSIRTVTGAQTAFSKGQRSQFCGETSSVSGLVSPDEVSVGLSRLLEGWETGSHRLQRVSKAGSLEAQTFHQNSKVSRSSRRVALHSVRWGFFVSIIVHVGCGAAVHQMILPPDGICDTMHTPCSGVSCRSYNVSTLRVPPPWVPERRIAMLIRMKETIPGLPSIPRATLCLEVSPGMFPPRHGRNGRGPLSSESSHNDGKFHHRVPTRRIALGAGNKKRREENSG